MIPLQISNNDILKGRGLCINTPNRFTNERRTHSPFDGFDPKEQDVIKTRYIDALPKTIVNKVDTKDVSYAYSLNPYQSCEHGCSNCYARNSHNYWGYSAGLDFESKILIKKNAPDLLDCLLSS